MVVRLFYFPVHIAHLHMWLVHMYTDFCICNNRYKCCRMTRVTFLWIKQPFPLLIQFLGCSKYQNAQGCVCLCASVGNGVTHHWFTLHDWLNPFFLFLYVFCRLLCDSLRACYFDFERLKNSLLGWAWVNEKKKEKSYTITIIAYIIDTRSCLINRHRLWRVCCCVLSSTFWIKTLICKYRHKRFLLVYL